MTETDPVALDVYKTVSSDEICNAVFTVAETEEKYLQELRRIQFDIAVVDLMLDTFVGGGTTMPGFDLISETKASSPNTKIFVLTHITHPSMILQAYRQGADCFLSRQDASLQSVKSTLQRLAKGEFIVTEKVKLRDANRIRAYRHPKLTSLRDDQIDMLGLMLSDLAKEDIAERLGFTSASAVYNKVSKMLKKTTAKNQKELLEWSVQAGMKHLLTLNGA